MSAITKPTSSANRILLQLEGLVVFIGAVALYVHLRGSGWIFALLLFAPDLSMIGYARGVRIGAMVYNTAHFYGMPAVLMAAALAGGWETGALLALIWFAHIGMDRTLGYGLKYPTEFKDTHLGHV